MVRVTAYTENGPWKYYDCIDLESATIAAEHLEERYPEITGIEYEYIEE